MKLNLKNRRMIRTGFKDIHVFFACDDAYIKYLMVSLTSLIDNSSIDNYYDIHILCTSVSKENVMKIKGLETPNVGISFHNVSENLEKLKSKLAIRDYYSATTYYRFFIPEMFPLINKALYMDADTVITQDVANLYNYRLGNNLIGAVQDMLVKNTKVYGDYVENVLNVSSAAYFNAGVVLLNCQLFRKEKVYNQFVDLLNAYTFVVAQDQDYLNILCQDRILWINSKWNVQMTEKEIRNPEDIGLIHYNLAEKPWHYDDGKYSEYFWKYAERTPFYEEIRGILLNYSEKDKAKDEQYGRNLLRLAVEETQSDSNFHKLLIPDENRQITRQEIVSRIEALEKEGRFDEDVENDPPGRMLMPNEIDYLDHSINKYIRTRYAFKMAKWFMNLMIQKRQLIVKGVEGIEYYRHLNSGAIITCNHFNAFDSFIMQITYAKSRQKGRKLYRVIKEGNYTSFPGFYGFLMRNCNTLPLSSNSNTMKKFLKAVNKLLKAGNFILVYPEQSMWWNYRKPKPLKKGAFRFAAEAGVPVLPCFVTMADSDIPGEGGFPVQEYTVHVCKPIYPDANMTLAQNIKHMMDENEREWKEVYEKTYGTELKYTCDENKIDET